VAPLPQHKTFRAILIKPSHYDDDGYVIQWVRSGLPANSLACVYALVEDCARRGVLGEDVDFEVIPYDETNTVIRVNRIIRDLKRADAGFVGLVGVQSNQFPRASDLARQFRAAGIPVVIGGFHVSGCLAMLPELPDDIKAAQAMGVTLFAGEAEGRMDGLLRDIWHGRLKPLYNFMNDLPEMSRAVPPFLPRAAVKKTMRDYSSFDAGRGCPFQCSFCTIINVQGRKSRYRTPDDIEAIIRANEAVGIRRFFITDDNFARNKNWEAILDRLIDLRENQGFRFKFTIQVDTLCHRMANFIEKAARAGCNRVFIGLENIDPDALMAAKKRQNKIWEYRKMLQAWKDVGATTYAGYIIGFPEDTPEKIRRNIEIIKRELPLDLLEFFFLTPLPGSEDHKVLASKGVWMDPDMSKYDLNHRVSHHPKMTDAEWEGIYQECWDIFFNAEHLETVLRRGAARNVNIKTLFGAYAGFQAAIKVEKLHPLEGGIFRRKVRTQRRQGLPRVHPLVFYPHRVYETTRSIIEMAGLYLRCRRVWKRVAQDPNRRAYTDLALQPSTEDESTDLMATFGEAIPDTYGAPVKRRRPAVLAPVASAG
jgi:radical SAM family protein